MLPLRCYAIIPSLIISTTALCVGFLFFYKTGQRITVSKCKLDYNQKGNRLTVVIPSQSLYKDVQQLHCTKDF